MAEKNTLKSFLIKNGLWISIVLLIAIMTILFLYPFMVVTVKSGQAGVRFERFVEGTVVDKPLLEGTHLKWPWDEIHIYNVRLQERHEKFPILTNEGLRMEIEVSIRLSPYVPTLGVLHKYIGPKYFETVVMPEIEAVSRDILGHYDPETIYSLKRDSIQKAISAKVLNDINQQIIVENELKDSKKQYLIFQDFFIKNIELPIALKTAIELKLEAEQELLEYQYLLQIADKEKERRIIEAEGIAEFQKISNISILKWRGLQVTETLSNSENSKLIVIGTDEQLPIILNGETSANGN